jgi:hypothetical protein
MRDESTPDFATGGAHETMLLTTFGRDSTLLRELITEAMNFVLQKEEGTRLLVSCFCFVINYCLQSKME